MSVGRTRVIIDTNFLFLPFTRRIDIFKEIDNEFGVCDLVMPSTVLRELETLRKGNTRDAMVASAVIKLAKQKATEGILNVVKTPRNVDEWILDEARKEKEKGTETKIAVCTLDSALSKNLKKLGVKVITTKRHVFV